MAAPADRIGIWKVKASNVSVSVGPARLHSQWLLLLILAVAFTGLTVEILLTRIFSVALWYHYAFIAISVALLGWGMGALLVQTQRSSTSPSELINGLVKYASLFTLSIPTALVFFSTIPALPDLLPLFYGIAAVPFFFGGACLSLAFKAMKQNAPRLYFADLTGAALAAVMLEPSLIRLGAESAILVASVLIGVATLLLSSRSRNGRLRKLVLAVLVVNLLAFGGNVEFSLLQVDPGPEKYLHYVLRDPEMNVGWTAWNAISRVDLVESTTRFMEDGWVGNIVLDGGASTPVVQWDGRYGAGTARLNVYTWISARLNYLPFDLAGPQHVLIIGSGGGSEIAFALTAGAKRVTAVELNPLVVEAARRLSAENGDVYDRPEVSVYIDDGRSFIARSKETYDLIDLRLVDTGAALAAGGYALVENYLYTVEAFQQYYAKLAEAGILFLVRWDFEMPKLTSLAIDVLSKQGIELQDIPGYIAAIVDSNSKASSTNFPLIFMLKKTPFSNFELKLIERVVTEDGSRLLFLKGIYEESPYRELFQGSISLQRFRSSFYYNRVSSPTDDRPFFFAIEEPFPSALWTPIGIVAVVSVVYATTLFRKGRQEGWGKNVKCATVAYFLSIGVAYITVEITLVQQFMIFLGYPTRAIVTIVFSLLFGSGLGSLLSRNIIGEKVKLAALPLIGIPAVILVYRSNLPVLLETFLASDVATRSVIAFLLVFPLGFLMGIPFPMGLRHLVPSENLIPLFWGINGIASVAGTVLTATIAMALGFGANLILSAVLYTIPPIVIAVRKDFPS